MAVRQRGYRSAMMKGGDNSRMRTINVINADANGSRRNCGARQAKIGPFFSIPGLQPHSQVLTLSPSAAVFFRGLIFHERKKKDHLPNSSSRFSLFCSLGDARAFSTKPGSESGSEWKDLAVSCMRINKP